MVVGQHYRIDEIIPNRGMVIKVGSIPYYYMADAWRYGAYKAELIQSDTALILDLGDNNE